MPLSEVQGEMVETVVQRFLNTKEPTPRILLVKRFKNPDALDDLLPVILKAPDGARLWPRVLAFECCGDADALRLARKSVEVVIQVLQSLFEDVEQEKMEFTTAEVEAHARKMFGTIEPQTIQLGLYFVQEFNGIYAGLGGNFPEFTFVRIHERIGMLKNIPSVWDDYISQFSLYLQPERGTAELTNSGSAHEGILERPAIPLKHADISPTKPSNSAAATASEGTARATHQKDEQWDLFISHASEDKQDIARPLAEALIAKGLEVWYDDFSLKLGDSLRASIDRGLARSRYGVVILSEHFFAKHWPQQELNGLATREVGGKKVILPVWHQIDLDEVRGHSPILADRKAVKTSEGLEQVVQRILDAIGVSPTVVRRNTAQQEEMVFEQSVYWKRKSGEREGPYCPVCYDDKHKMIRLTPGATQGTYQCGVCQNGFWTDEYDSRPGRGRPFSSGR